MNRRGFLAALAGAAVLPQVPDDLFPGLSESEFLIWAERMRAKARTFYPITWKSLGDFGRPNASGWVSFPANSLSLSPWPVDDIEIYAMASRNRLPNLSHLKIVEFKGKRFAQWIYA